MTVEWVAGVDEVGRGPLAGSVVAAAVILPADMTLPGLRDSKRLAPRRRRLLAEQIRAQAIAWALGAADHAEIDQFNILQATMLAMQRAVGALIPAPHRVQIDGNRIPELPMPAQAIIKGDDRIAAISAASILAKVTRDAQMQELDERYPGYGFARNKGYPSAEHRVALARLGPCPIHRRSFAPVRAAAGLP